MTFWRLMFTIVPVFIVILVGISIMGPLSEQINIAANSMNNSSTNMPAATLLKITPGIFAFAILFGAILIGWSAFRNTSDLISPTYSDTTPGDFSSMVKDRKVIKETKTRNEYKQTFNEKKTKFDEDIG